MNGPSFMISEKYSDDIAPLIAGVELGGTKCICTLSSSPDEVVDQQTIPTTTPEVTLAAIAQVLSGWWCKRRFAALGIASFGPVDLDPTSKTYGYIVATNKPNWSMTDVRSRLSSEFDVPCAFDTDVNGAATAEMLWGAGKGLNSLAYITVGTGVGVGSIVNGRPVLGFTHTEMGHLRVPRRAGDNLPSACTFHDDCVEGLASGAAIKVALGTEHVSTVAAAHVIWDRVSSAIVALCHGLVCSTAPKRVIIGGGVIAKQPHLLERLEPELRRSLNGYIELPSQPYIVAPGLGDQAGPMGPMALALVQLGMVEGVSVGR